MLVLLWCMTCVVTGSLLANFIVIFIPDVSSTSISMWLVILAVGINTFVGLIFDLVLSVGQYSINVLKFARPVISDITKKLHPYN